MPDKDNQNVRIDISIVTHDGVEYVGLRTGGDLGLVIRLPAQEAVNLGAMLIRKAGVLDERARAAGERAELNAAAARAPRHRLRLHRD